MNLVKLTLRINPSFSSRKLIMQVYIVDRHRAKYSYLTMQELWRAGVWHSYAWLLIAGDVSLDENDISETAA